jgi:hypothetical protein
MSVHASLLVHDFLANMNQTVLRQLPYSPDLAQADFFFISQTDIHKITENSQTELRIILKKVYQDCFQKWQQCSEQFINAGGECFEGNKAHPVAAMSKKNDKITVPKLCRQTT